MVVAMSAAMPMVSMTMAMAMWAVMMARTFMDDDRGRRDVGPVSRIVANRRARTRVVVIDPRRRTVVTVSVPVSDRAGAGSSADDPTDDSAIAPTEGLAEQCAGAGANHGAHHCIRGLCRSPHREPAGKQADGDDSTDFHCRLRVRLRCLHGSPAAA